MSAHMRALGDAELADEVRLADGAPYRRSSVLQHGFFAATGLYSGPRGKMVVKAGREASFFGLPLRWLGRWLVNRELEMYARCAGIEGVPGSGERIADTRFARSFVEGHPLERGERVDDAFFPRLEELVSRIHERGVAFVDLQKCANVLVDASGRPWLVDFQTAWHWPERRERRGGQRWIPDRLGRFILRRLQAGDRFHVLKHWRRCRPDTISPEKLESTHHPDGWMRVHRAVHNRWRALRKRLRERREP
jgi:hypothetical protein